MNTLVRFNARNCVGSALIVFVVVISHTCQVSGRNDRPIIGIFTQESDPSFKKYGDTYLPANYVKYLEAAGARVVPIRVNENDAYYQKLFEEINGMLLPGGSVDLLTSYYGKAAKRIYDLAIKANDAGDYFPVWGSCLGFEMLTALTTGQDLLTNCHAEDLQLPLQLTPEYQNSRLFQNMPATVLKIVTTLNVTANFHRFCLTPKNFTKSIQLTSFYKVLSTNKDRGGKVFISTIEAIKYPIYGVQWHPEKNSYQWTTAYTINHSGQAVYAMQYFADFFVNEARKSNHKFPNEEEESDSLIDNYQPVFFKAPSYREMYFFNFTKDTSLKFIPSRQ